MTTEHLGSWVAIFTNGPAVGHERIMAVGPIRTDIYLMPHPREDLGWIRVDINGGSPDPPWPDQAHYHLVDIRAGGDGEPVCHYEEAE